MKSNVPVAKTRNRLQRNRFRRGNTAVCLLLYLAAVPPIKAFAFSFQQSHHPLHSIGRAALRSPAITKVTSSHTKRKVHRNRKLRGVNISQLQGTAMGVAENYQDENSSSLPEWTPLVASIALPAMIGMIADPLLSLVDTVFVGRLGSNELASLGACTSIFHLSFHTFKATTAVTTSLVSSALANNDEDQARSVLSTSLQFAVVCGVVVMVSLGLGATAALAFMGVPQSSDLYRPALTYLRIRLLAAPAVLLITVCEGAFRGRGDTRTPLLASSLAAVSNLILDPLLMFGPVPALRLGIGGAAAATAASQYIASAAYLFCVKKRGMMPDRKKKSKSNMDQKLAIVKEIVLANVAMLSRQLSLLLLWAFATAKATRIGYAHVATHQVALSFWLVFALVMDGPCVAAQVITNRILYSDDVNVDPQDGKSTYSQEQNLDTKPNDVANTRLRYFDSFMKFLLGLAIAQGLASTIFMLAIPTVIPSFFKLFTNDANILPLLEKLIPVLGWQQLLVSLSLVFEGVISGAKNFFFLSVCTNLSAAVAAAFLAKANNINQIWMYGISGFFLLRFFTSAIGIGRLARGLRVGRSSRLDKDEVR